MNTMNVMFALYGKKCINFENFENFEIPVWKKKKCCICGREYSEFGNNAHPIRKGSCCDYCNMRFVIPARVFLSKNPGTINNFEIVKSNKELNEIEHKLLEKDFEIISRLSSMKLYKNPETEENVIICMA